MSGIVGIVNQDGEPVDRELLWRLTNALTYRGPDAQEIWVDGNVGFGHTMLRTTWEAENEKQPLTLDRLLWLTADARIDGREELIAKLEAKLHRKLSISDRSNGAKGCHNDADLILLAYEAWSDDCTKHLIGDFSFAIWNSPEHRLFCARDHFGIKPFFYTRTGNTFVFSNTLNCLRTFPGLSDELDERFIGDFLLFDMCCDTAITAFSNIKRLPPAHQLSISCENLTVKRFWSLPSNRKLVYPRPKDYLDQFNLLLDQALKDRLRTNRVAVFMSGGLDSSTVATNAWEQLSKDARGYDLRACTIVYDKLFYDPERHYSGLVAEKLNIPIDYLVADDYELYEGGKGADGYHPEPIHDPLRKVALDSYLEAGQHSRVVLTGYGLDPALTPSHSHAIDLIKRLELFSLAKDASWFLARGEFPRLGLRESAKKFLRLSKENNHLEFPTWLNASFVHRAKLRERWSEIMFEPLPTFSNKPQAYRSLVAPFWTSRFERDDPGVTFANVENRYPFFDLRLLTFLLALPAVPWCIGKELIRIAMRDRLPDEVRLRPKTPLMGDPIFERHKKNDLSWSDDYKPPSSLNEYVDVALIPRLTELNKSYDLWTNLRPLSLSFWLAEFFLKTPRKR
jgi:asparagine synthase (glutamine-hydrolysing)